MSCKTCHSNNQTTLHSEIAIHFPPNGDKYKPIALAFPSLTICLSCGFTEGRMDDSELKEINEGLLDDAA